jgi:predicted dehydrogenase
MLSTCAEARRRGLSIVSGLSWRRDPATVAAIGRIHAGAIGRPLHAVASSCIGLPWHWPAQPAWTAAETVRRNWIACERQSGGHFVEQQIHPLDKLLWALGDAQPLAAEAIAAGGDGHAGTAVRYHFADGRTLEAGIVRRAGGPDRIEERVHGTAGTCDLRRHATAAGGRHRLGMEALVRAVRSGSREDDGDALCRSTLAALLGRAAAARGGTVSWAALAADPAPVGAALAAGLAALQPV